MIGWFWNDPGTIRNRLMMMQKFKYELYDQRFNQKSDYELIMAVAWSSDNEYPDDQLADPKKRSYNNHQIDQFTVKNNFGSS